MQIILGVGALALMVLCAVKEGGITARYRANKVYGRFKAYLALALTLLGLVSALSGLIPALSSMGTGLPIPVGLAMLAAGVLLYVMTFLKCPAHLKKLCIPCMILSGFGVALKICLFFLPFVWRTSGGDIGGVPETVQDANGNTCRTRMDGDFLYITRPDGSEDSVRMDYIDQGVLQKKHIISTGSGTYRW